MNDQSQMMLNQQHHQVTHMVAPPSQAPPQLVVNQMSYGQWTQPQPQLQPPVIMNPMNMNFPNSLNPMFVTGSNPNPNNIPKPKPGRSGGNSNNWKGKKPAVDTRKRKDYFNMMSMNNNNNNMILNRNLNVNVNNSSNGGKGLGTGGGGVVPTLYELEQHNRVKGRRFYHSKRKFNRMGPYAHAPRNTTSYLIRAKKSGGIASLVSPCPVTPAVLPTPVFSPSREALVDMAKEEWGVDGYGSMKGLIRLRSPGHDESVDDYDDEEDGGSSGSDVEEHVEVERRLDHDLSRFEMIVPSSGGGVDHHNLLENRVDDQDAHIARLEEENLILKERLYLMEREVGEMRRRLLCLERRNQDVEDINEEVLENVSENYSEGLRNIPLLVTRDNEEVDSVPRDGEIGAYGDHSDETMHKELRELAVKEAFCGEAMESNEYGAGLVGNICKDGLLKNGVGFVTTVDKKGVEHDQELAGELSEKCESMKTKDLVSADGTKLFTVDAVEAESTGDVYMGENVPDKVNDIDNSGNVVNNGSEAVLKKENKTMEFETQAEDNSDTVDNKVTGDVCMGDMLSTYKAIGGHKSDG